MVDPKQEDRRSGIERHAQTIIQIIITLLLVWVGNSIITLRESSIRIEETHKQMSSMYQRIEIDIGLLRTAITQLQGTLNSNAVAVADHERRITKMESVGRR